MLDSVEKSTTSVDKAQVATLLDQETYARFADKAAANERSIAAELRLAVKRHLEDGPAA